MKKALFFVAVLLSLGLIFRSDVKTSAIYASTSIKLELRSDGTFRISNETLKGHQDGVFYLSGDSTQLQLFPFFSVNDSVLVFEQKYKKKLKLDNGFIQLVNKTNDILLFTLDSTWNEVSNNILPKSNVKFFTSEFGFKDLIVNEGVNEIVIKKVSKVGSNKMRKILFNIPILDNNQYCIYNKDSIVLTINRRLYTLKRITSN